MPHSHLNVFGNKENTLINEVRVKMTPQTVKMRI